MLIPPAYAQAAGASSGVPDFFLTGIAPLLFVFVAFYFLMLRPQQRRQKEQQATIDAVKKGDSVVTAGGIQGKVTRVEDKVAEVEIAPNVRVRVIKSTLAEVVSASSKPAND